MNDQQNKQQQPQQGNKQNSQDGNMKNRVQGGGDIGEGDIEHPDQQPDKKVTIDDNPDETQKKVPNMQNKY